MATKTKAPARNPVSRGVGESKRFIADPGTFADPAVLDCHVGGIAVRDLPMDAQVRLLYQQTDEGIAERNAGREEIHVRVTSDPLSKSIQHRRDDLSAGMQPWEAHDPLKELADRYTPEGHSPKFLSDSKCAKDGTRGFEVIKDEKGDPIKLGTLRLASMPIEKRDQRNAFYREKSRNAVNVITEEYQATHDRLLSGRGNGPSQAIEELDSPNFASPRQLGNED